MYFRDFSKWPIKIYIRQFRMFTHMINLMN